MELLSLITVGPMDCTIPGDTQLKDIIWSSDPILLSVKISIWGFPLDYKVRTVGSLNHKSDLQGYKVHCINWVHGICAVTTNTRITEMYWQWGIIDISCIENLQQKVWHWIYMESQVGEIFQCTYYNEGHCSGHSIQSILVIKAREPLCHFNIGSQFDQDPLTEVFEILVPSYVKVKWKQLKFSAKICSFTILCGFCLTSFTGYSGHSKTHSYNSSLPLCDDWQFSPPFIKFNPINYCHSPAQQTDQWPSICWVHSQQSHSHRVWSPLWKLLEINAFRVSSKTWCCPRGIQVGK